MYCIQSNGQCCFYVSLTGVFCEGKSLTRVPAFRNVSRWMNYHAWTIDFKNNSISYLPDYAFSNLKEYGNGYNVSVLLGKNELGKGNISCSAFSGIEPLVLFVDLEENQLQFIPSFISKLPNLYRLNVLHNPISYIDPLIFTSVHKALYTLTISVGDLPSWPQPFSVLTELVSLVIETKHHNIPTSAFTGLNQTLRHLTTINTDLVETSSVYSLGVLASLSIIYCTV